MEIVPLRQLICLHFIIFSLYLIGKNISAYAIYLKSYSKALLLRISKIQNPKMREEIMVNSELFVAFVERHLLTNIHFQVT